MASQVRLETLDGVARITFARPERLNAFDFAMGRDYRDACLAATSDASTRAIVISAQGRAFCAGGDVLAMAEGGAGPQVTESAHAIHEGIAALVGSPIPVAAAARGAVAGGGIGLLLAADYVIAGEDLRVAGKYSDIGLTPDLGVSTLLTRAVGERRALQILLGGLELDAEAALAWGVAAEVAADPEERALGLARRWAQAASGALGQAKRLVRASSARPFHDSLADEAHTIGRAFDGEEAKARIAAFAKASASRGAAR
ncbi:enoyl-CoA hydratase/isomerase family protein [Demequina sp. NBRC 110053]|uniref:enoyl-CoA hydratase/isomerase family protein n=1 Tax=Demequina sp. NBRC 110053 TaxID=1570342 RepID=UPI000A07195B|nr:enoyl-CoA hydratase/isomerase family protein [Demequina sp. NBRC 110053]